MTNKAKIVKKASTNKRGPRHNLVGLESGTLFCFEGLPKFPYVRTKDGFTSLTDGETFEDRWYGDTKVYKYKRSTEVVLSNS